MHLFTFMTMVQALTSMGNWSVSQPKSGDPVLESMEPNMPNLQGKAWAETLETWFFKLNAPVELTFRKLHFNSRHLLLNMHFCYCQMSEHKPHSYFTNDLSLADWQSQILIIWNKYLRRCKDYIMLIAVSCQCCVIGLHINLKQFILVKTWVNILFTFVLVYV